jgi:iron complex outermembrane recepter protein
LTVDFTVSAPPLAYLRQLQYAAGVFSKFICLGGYMTRTSCGIRKVTSVSRQILLSCASFGLAGTAGAVAAAAAGSELLTLQEIVVTAQRREERLQDVPVAVSAFGAEDLAKLGVADIGSLRGSVPGLTITHTAGVNASNLITIRGVGGLPLAIGAGQATGIYLDGVYLSRVDAGFFSLDDVERVEVLRGPQGTLYGRNATAGAVNIITRDPGDQLRGGFDVNYGNYAAKKIKGSVSGPISGHWSGGLSGSYEDRDGYFTNTVTGNAYDFRRASTLRGKLRYANGDFSAVLADDYTQVKGREPFKNTYVGGVYVGLGDVNAVTVAARNEELAGLNDRSGGIALTMNYKLSDGLDLTSITSQRTLDIRDAYNFSAVPIIQSFLAGSARTLSQELHLLVTRSRLRATLGANYYGDRQFFGLQTIPVPATGPLLQTNPIRFSSNIKSWALFGQFEFDLTQRATLVAGARYGNEKRDWMLDTTVANPPGTPPYAVATGTIKDTDIAPTLGLNFKLKPDLLLYGKISKGYQAPGFNSGANGPTLLDLLTRGEPLQFGAETLWAYEAGMKSQFMERRLTLNVAAFYYDYKDLQVRNNLGSQSTTSVGSVIINNAASAKVTGIEAEFRAQLSRDWSAGVQATKLSAKYRNYCQAISVGSPVNGAPPCTLPNSVTIGADRTGYHLNQAPDWSGGVSMAYSHQFAAGSRLAASAQYSWESNVYYSPVNEVPASSEGGWKRLDARLGYELGNGVEFYAFGKNLNDKRYVSWVTRANATGLLVSFSEPRTVGLGVRYQLKP